MGQMPLSRIIINNFKSIKKCNIALSDLNILIGENGTGKTSFLEAISYFYDNLTGSSVSDQVFDKNNHYSNEMNITLVFDFSQFVKISKANSDIVIPGIIEDHPADAKKYSGYYRKIISMAAEAPGFILSVRLSQVKGLPIRWNYSYADRQIFKSLFPIFYIDTRNLDLTEWGYIWDVLGELGKVSNIERDNIREKISEILLDQSREISKKIKGIVEIFNSAEVSIKRATPKDYAKELTKVFFSGEIIQQGGKNLKYFSTGTNSVKYIELLIKSIEAISKAKLKEPIVLFDEPEIGLHTHYLNELSEAVLDVNSRLCLILSTHSSRLIKNIIQASETAALFSVRLVEKCTNIQRMKKFPQYSPTSKYRVADDHINSYFSRGILFVEGETELELFSNPYLRALFPKIKQVDVFKAVSDRPVMDIMNPSKLHTTTPYICLIDMDKAISFNLTSNLFTLKSEYFPHNGREAFQFRSKKNNTPYLHHQRIQIDAMCNKLHIHYYLPFYSCNDACFSYFIESIHQYLLAYNVFSFSTTIEGALINSRTKDFALDFLKSQISPPIFGRFKSYWDTLKRTDQLNSLRMVYNGKSDLLKTRKEISSNLSQCEKNILESANIGKKASGWISDFLDSFFRAPNNGQIPFSGKDFGHFLRDDENRKKAEKSFSYCFPELYSLVVKLCDMI